MKETKCKEHIDWEYLRDIPIEDVAESLGIDIDRYGHALCPCHNDHNPSMKIGSKTNEKYKNRWWCPVCNEGGTPLDLVLARNYGIPPSDVRKNRGQYAQAILEAAHYLDKICPGGIIKISEEPNIRGIKEPSPPTIPSYILRDLDLKENPLYSVKPPFELLSKTDRAELLLNKLQERELDLWSYGVGVLKNFPDLDSKAAEYVLAQSKEWVSEIHGYTEQARDYYFAISDYEYGDTFVDELSIEMEKETNEDEMPEIECA